MQEPAVANGLLRTIIEPQTFGTRMLRTVIVVSDSAGRIGAVSPHALPCVGCLHDDSIVK
jgi:hypothetical protein